MRAVMEQVALVAARETTVLLTGETGTGKTVVARTLHDLSGRRAEPFRVAQCAALAAGLVEDELFGHVKGAFTGAERARPGKLAEAGRGTLLLDDVDTLSPEAQAKLLRAVEAREFEPVGSDRPRRLEARLVAASNRPLEEEVRAGRFRPDLFYRLAVVSLRVPPLRERPEDIPALAVQFLAESAAHNRRPVRRLSAGAMALLCAYAWPGNVRELRNAIEHADVLGKGPEIGPADLPDSVRAAAAGRPRPAVPLASARDEAEWAQIEEALRRTGNNRTRAAAELGIGRRTLYDKLHRLGRLGGDESPPGPEA
jgi:two-component system response regulator HydG